MASSAQQQPSPPTGPPNRWTSPVRTSLKAQIISRGGIQCWTHSVNWRPLQSPCWKCIDDSPTIGFVDISEGRPFGKMCVQDSRLSRIVSQRQGQSIRQAVFRLLFRPAVLGSVEGRWVQIRVHVIHSGPLRTNHSETRVRERQTPDRWGFCERATQGAYRCDQDESPGSVRALGTRGNPWTMGTAGKLWGELIKLIVEDADALKVAANAVVAKKTRTRSIEDPNRIKQKIRPHLRRFGVSSSFRGMLWHLFASREYRQPTALGKQGTLCI